jgi:hypothetical protein
MAIATALGSGLAGMAMTRPTLVWGPSALASKLPRVRLLPSEQQTPLLLSPPALGGRVPLTSRLPPPPGFQFENGPRQIILRPDFRMTHDRRGGYVCLRGTF